MSFEIDYIHGWHAPEYWEGISTRWMGREAHFIINAPHGGLVEFSFYALSQKPGTLVLSLHQGPIPLLTVPLQSNVQQVRSFVSVSPGVNYVTVRIEGEISSPAARGESSDSRELSIAAQDLQARLLA